MSLKHYDFAESFRAVYEKAMDRYGSGARSAAELLDAGDKGWLAANGITPQHLFDYAEDESNYGEPGFGRALTIEHVRRSYFLNIQAGKSSTAVLDESRLPAKADAVDGIAWLPRLIPKAKAKLRGELPPSLMFCCGGDRKFFKEHDIDPAEFLSVVWANEQDDRAIVAWVKKRRG